MRKDFIIVWRDGADSEEIEKIEHIDGAMFAAQYKNAWNEDEEKTVKIKSSAKRSSSTAKKRKTTTPSKTKTPKKASKKAK
jgi:hypothetical protein